MITRKFAWLLGWRVIVSDVSCVVPSFDKSDICESLRFVLSRFDDIMINYRHDGDENHSIDLIVVHHANPDHPIHQRLKKNVNIELLLPDLYGTQLAFRCRTCHPVVAQAGDHIPFDQKRYVI